MPSIEHDSLVELFRNRPSLAAEISVEVLGIAFPRYTEARVASVDLTEVKPPEYRADMVVVHMNGDTAVYAIVVEVQLGPDSRKRYSWPAYVAVARAVHRC